MSDLCMYEFEDNVWDEFGQSDDHIVPYPPNEHEDGFASQADSRKKLRHDVVGVSSSADDNVNKYGIQGEESSFPFLTKKDTMLEKGSWSDTPDHVFPASCDGDSVKEVRNVSSEDSRMSNHVCKSNNIGSDGPEFCTNDPVLGDRSTTADNNLYRYPINPVSQTDDGLNFFNNDHEDKETSDLFYGWPDIGNFEDVDRMFRNCESTFGLGSLSNEEDLCWFSSSHPTEVCEDALKSDSKLNSILEHHDASHPNDEGTSTDDSKESTFVGDKISFQSIDVNDAALVPLSSGKVSNTKSQNQDDLMPSEQRKYLNQPEGKRKGRYLEHGSSFHHYDKSNQISDVKHQFGETSHQAFSPSGLQRHNQNAGSDSLSYMQTHIQYMHMNYGHSPDQISVSPIISSTKSENNGPPSSSSNESSYASNKVQPMESIHGPVVGAPVMLASEKRGKLPRHQDLQVPFTRDFKHANVSKLIPFSDSVYAQKQVRRTEEKIEAHSEVEGASLGVPAELESLNAQESSCMSSELDEISLEANSFRQLQQVMEQLDIKTKLCIRDSLYRLARSAEQRHNCLNLNGGTRDDRDANQALMAEERNKCPGFLDMETGTNPIDRSIAHLLFHRPSDASAMPVNESVSYKSHAMIHGSAFSPTVMSEKKEQLGAAGDKKMLTSDEK